MEVISALFTPAMLILMNLKLISYLSILDITDVLESKLIVILSKLHGEVTVFHPGREDPQNPHQNKLKMSKQIRVVRLCVCCRNAYVSLRSGNPWAVSVLWGLYVIPLLEPRSGCLVFAVFLLCCRTFVNTVNRLTTKYILKQVPSVLSGRMWAFPLFDGTRYTVKLARANILRVRLQRLAH